MKKLVLFTFVFILLLSHTIQGVYVDRTLTKAICSGNSCQDFLVSCHNNIIVELKPISGEIVFDEGWEDLREDKDKLC